MANRHLSRSIAVQSLFEWDFNKMHDGEIEEIVDRNIETFAPGLEDSTYTQALVKGVLDHKDEIDEVIQKVAPEWPLDQIALVDKGILRLGFYELLFEDKRNVPSKVAINEAVELAKTFGGDASRKFVNGVLGTVYREIGGEEEETKRQMEVEELSGAVVYRKEDDGYYFALVHDVFGYWTLSKGHVKEGEKIPDSIVREIKEEIGLNVRVGNELGSNEYKASDPERGKIKKRVEYFLASTTDKDINLKETGGLDGAQWFKMEELGDLKMYDDIRDIVAKGIEILVAK